MAFTIGQSTQTPISYSSPFNTFTNIGAIPQQPASIVSLSVNLSSCQLAQDDTILQQPTFISSLSTPSANFAADKLKETFAGDYPIEGYKKGLFFQQNGNPSQNPQMSESGLILEDNEPQQNKVTYEAFGGIFGLPLSFVSKQPNLSTANPSTPLYPDVILDSNGIPIADQTGQPITSAVG
jgi:hypothetical protein